MAQESEVNRAGLICFNMAGQVLLVSALANDKVWVFPKGHLEKDETPPKAAEREALEEANIIATSLYKIGITEYRYKGEDVCVEWWTGCAVRRPDHDPTIEYLESDFREQRWVYPEEALELLSFDDMRTILKKALCWKEN